MARTLEEAAQRMIAWDEFGAAREAHFERIDERVNSGRFQPDHLPGIIRSLPGRMYALGVRAVNIPNDIVTVGAASYDLWQLYRTAEATGHDIREYPEPIDFAYDVVYGDLGQTALQDA